MTSVRRVGVREVYSGRVFDVTVERFVDDDEPGDRAFDIEVVRHNGGAGALAVGADGRVTLVRQWRYPLGRYSLEIPAGRIEAGDEPLASARRELEEEAGLRARTWAPLAEVHSAPGFTDERLYLYLATDLEASEQNLDEDERVEVTTLGLDEALALVDSGEIDDAKTVVALLKAARMRAGERR